MYAMIQTRFHDVCDKSNHNIGIVSTWQSYTTKFEILQSLTYRELVPEIKQLKKKDFKELNVGFYLILE